MAMESSKTMGMHHHHHHRADRNEPTYDEFHYARYSIGCIDHLTPDRPWSDCFGTTKSAAHGANSRS
jgi:hypothetical protein